MALPNDFKKEDTDPDYNLFVVPRENGKPKEDDIPVWGEEKGEMDFLFFALNIP